MSRHVRRLLIATVALADAALFIVYQRPDWNTQWSDQNGYLMLGRNLARASRFTRFADTAAYVPEPIRTPGYPVFVAALDALFGESHLVIAIAQAVLFAIVCLLVEAIARRVASDRVAFAAGLVTALYPPLPYFGALVLTEMFTTFLVTAGMAVWLYAIRRNSTAGFVGAGLLLAATALTRPAFQFLPLFVAAALLLVPGDRRPRWRGSAVMLAAFTVAVVPWLAYNVVYFRTLTFSPAGGPGRQVFEGTWQVELPGRVEAELTALADATTDRLELDERIREVAARSKLSPERLLQYVHQHQDIRRIWTEPRDPLTRISARIAADHEYLRVGLENIREHPFRHVWGRATRGTFLLWAAEIPVRYSDINRLSPAAVRALWLPQVLLMLISVWGMAALARRGARVESFAMAALVVYVSAFHMPMYSEARYSLPAKPIVLLLATVGIVELIDRRLPPSRSHERECGARTRRTSREDAGAARG
jgi:4-amino-4-deoxy-L-arabinose transferase-like glycosyltransferase